jgi:Ca-activated chloride channel homolog
MSFSAPERLWLFVAVAAVGLAYLAAQVGRRRYEVRFTNLALLDVVAPHRPGWRRHVPAALFLLAGAALVGAVAQPFDEVRVPRERATVVLAIDTSLSMQATDVAPSRIEAAQQAARSFVAELPSSINLGLVTFDGIARVRVTPTTDRAPVLAAVDALELAPSTAIGEAIFASLDAVAAAPPADDGSAPPARIVVMSDGKTTVGRPNEQGTQAALDAGIAVSTIAFGTPDGEIYVPDQPTPVGVAVQPGPLRDIAEVTGGTFFEAGSLDELEAVYDDIGSAVGYETEERDITVRFVAIGLVLLLATAVASLLWFSRLP